MNQLTIGFPDGYEQRELPSVQKARRLRRALQAESALHEATGEAAEFPPDPTDESPDGATTGPSGRRSSERYEDDTASVP